MKEKKSFIFYADTFAIVRRGCNGNREMLGEVLDAVISYINDESLPEIRPEAYMAFLFIQKQIDANYEEWLVKVEKNRESGRRGGLASGSKRLASGSKRLAN